MSLVAQCFRKELYPQLEFLYLFQDLVRLLDLFSLWQLILHGFLNLLVLGILAFGFGIVDLIFLFDLTLLLQQESEPLFQINYIVDFRFLFDLQCDLRKQVELLWIWEPRFFNGLNQYFHLLFEAFVKFNFEHRGAFDLA